MFFHKFSKLNCHCCSKQAAKLKSESWGNKALEKTVMVNDLVWDKLFLASSLVYLYPLLATGTGMSSKQDKS